MIAYVTLGTQNLARAAGFYDALLAEIGGKLNVMAWDNSSQPAGCQCGLQRAEIG